MQNNDQFDEKNFLDGFKEPGHERALELLLSALINTHPNPQSFRTAIDFLIKEEERLYYEAADSLHGDAAASARAMMKVKFAAIRDKAERIISATVGDRSTG